jgi:hypothetical protein
MTRHELCRARQLDVIRLARWLGVGLSWDTTREQLIDSTLVACGRIP